MAGTPQVTGGICIDSSKPLYPSIEVGSPFWFTWLREPDVRSFHFESECGKFTARKEQRPTSTNEYWYAYRKIQGKLRKVYLGAMDELSLDRLNEVAAEISQSGQDYYYSRKSYIVSREQNSAPATTAASLTLEAIGYPTKEVINCVTNSSELEALRSEVEQLSKQLALVTAELSDERAQKNSSELELKTLRLEVEQSRSQLEQVRTSEKDLLDQVCSLSSEQFKAADILKGALTLKANAGGAIKEKIREALKLIDDI